MTPITPRTCSDGTAPENVGQQAAAMGSSGALLDELREPHGKDAPGDSLFSGPRGPFASLIVNGGSFYISRTPACRSERRCVLLQWGTVLI